MEKRLTKAYYILLAASILVFVFVVMHSGNRVMEKLPDTKAVLLNEQLEINSGKDSVSATGILPDMEMSGKILAFFSKHADVKVYIGEEEVYLAQPAKDSMISTTGYLWNIIHMKEAYEGQPFRIEVHSVYGNEITLNDVYYGSEPEVIKSVLRKNGIEVLLSGVITLVGIVFILYVLFVYCTKKTGYSLQHLAVFTTIYGIWNLLDSRAVSLVLRYPIALNTVNHICLMIMTIPFALFLRSIYQEKHDRLWGGFCCFNSLVVIVRILLQAFGIMDFKKTLFLTHIVLVVFFVVVLYASAMEVFRNKNSVEIKISILCVVAVMILSGIDLINYRLNREGSFYASIGYLAYIVVMELFSMKRNQKVVEQMHEVEIYRKLAYTDELTGLFNRMAYQRDVEDRQKNGISSTAVVMIDLNELKRCNDNFGHSYGDQYISRVASEIHEVFGMKGRCYRVGGDEFIVLFSEPEKIDVEALIDRFRRRLHDLNRSPFVVEISAAVGMAVYDPEQDKNLEDTRNRADQRMYENKQQYKMRRSHQGGAV